MKKLISKISLTRKEIYGTIPLTYPDYDKNYYDENYFWYINNFKEASLLYR